MVNDKVKKVAVSLFMRHTSRHVRENRGTFMMWERLVLAGIATFCIYLFLHLGNNSTQPKLIGQSLIKPPHFIFNLPLLSR
jgi:hypothetical protein